MPWTTNVAVTLQAGNTIINPSGDFVYNPSVGAGNLVASLTPGSTTADSFGNATVGEVSSYGPAGGLSWAVSMVGPLLAFSHAATEAGPYTTIGDLEGSTIGGGALFINFPLVVFGGPVSGGLTTDTLAVTTAGGLTVGGSSSTSTNGLPNGQITNTSGPASAGTAHTHSAGSYAVTNGQHSHTL